MQDRQTLYASRLEAFTPVAWELIPDLGLYMDQVITYLERTCGGLFMEGERIFTSSMVNNYVKFGLVDRPIGKKYGREQLAQLLMICVLKQAASVDGMKQLLKVPEGETLRTHYERFCGISHAIFTELGLSLPLPSTMDCAIRGAAYHFLCGAVLTKQDEPTVDPKRTKQTDELPAKEERS